MRRMKVLILLAVAAGLLVDEVGMAAGPTPGAAQDKLYQVVDGKVDKRTYNGYRRYNSICIHCHGPDGIGGSFAPSLIAAPLDLPAVRLLLGNIHPRVHVERMASPVVTLHGRGRGLRSPENSTGASCWRVDRTATRS